MKMTGNTILITGGTSGIGHGLALRLHQASNKVIVAGRRREWLERIAAENPGIETIVLDVADPASIAGALRQVEVEHPDLNVLVNNAGIMVREDLQDPDSLAVGEQIVATNLLGVIRMVYAFLPLLAEKDDAAIINVASALAFVPLPVTPTYNATKAAVHSFTQSLRVQVDETPVQVIELVPSSVQTALFGQEEDEQAQPLDSFLAEVMTALEASPEAEEIVVEAAGFVRFAEARGTYEDVFTMLSDLP